MSHQPRTRRSLFRAAGGLAVAGAVPFAIGAAAPVRASSTRQPAAPSSTDRKERTGQDVTASVTLRWLGNAGWRIDIGSHTVLVDPFLSRFHTGLMDGNLDPSTRLTVKPEVVNRYIGKPENVLVTHSHWDHFADVPYIARHTGARVIGTVTTHSLATASKVPADQLATVKGGEVLDFDAYSVEVVASLHSRNSAYGIALPGRHEVPPDEPRTVADLPEGDTLAFQIRVVDGPSIFVMGASDFVERNLTGLAPDIAMIPLNYSDTTLDYPGRLLAALDHPATVVPVHWDHFERPLRNPPRQDPEAGRWLPRLLDEIERAAPDSRIVLPEYWKPLAG